MSPPAFSTAASLRAPQLGISHARTCPRTRMAAGVYVGDGLQASDVVTVGIATCFKRTGNKLEEVLVLEPLPASAVHCIAELRVPTSYRRLYSTTLGQLSDEVSHLPKGVIGADEQVALGENFGERVRAASRTFRRSPEIAAIVPPGNVLADINYSVATKRILNESWEPNFEDNVKQDISIDVYNRGDENIDSSSVTQAYNA